MLENNYTNSCFSKFRDCLTYVLWQKKFIDISTSLSLPQNSLHDSQSRENLKLRKEFTQSELGKRDEERGNAVKARAEIETGNERERKRETNGDRKSRKHSRSVKSLRVCMEGGKETTKGR